MDHRRRDEVLCHTFRKNRREEVRIALITLGDRPYCDLRVYTLGADGEWHATKRGLTLAPHLIAELEEGLRLARRRRPRGAAA